MVGQGFTRYGMQHVTRRALALAGRCRLSTAPAAPAPTTIFALSTPPGAAALAVVRVSGPAALPALARLLAPGARAPPPRAAALRTLHHPLTRAPLDAALVLAFPAPRSATGEDVVELHLHGGRAVVAAVLGALGALRRELALAPARPGEFTRRGYLAGRLTLAQCEALGDLLGAETEAQRAAAVAALGGALAARASAWRAALLHNLANVEAVLDFAPDEPDVRAGALLRATAGAARSLAGELARERARGARGELVRGGVPAVLAGAPNAGKSSLLNALLARPAAIVAPTAGTTRDVLRVSLDLGGVLCILSDTAGLRGGLREGGGEGGGEGGEGGSEGGEGGSVCAVEAEGIARARAELAGASVRILVVDSAALAGALAAAAGQQGGSGRGAGALAALLPPGARKCHLLVLNKCDLARVPEEAALGALAALAAGEGEGGGGGGGGGGGERRRRAARAARAARVLQDRPGPARAAGGVGGAGGGGGVGGGRQRGQRGQRGRRSAAHAAAAASAHARATQARRGAVLGGAGELFGAVRGRGG